MPSDASLPPNAPTMNTSSASPSSSTAPQPNGLGGDHPTASAATQQQQEPEPERSTQTKAVRTIDGEADAFHTIKLPGQPGALPEEEEMDGEEVLQVAPNPVPLSEVCADVNRRVEAFLAAEGVSETARRTQKQVRESVGVIERALEEYGFEHLSLSYNGGKDCLVLLILYLSVLHTHFTRPSSRRKAADDATADDSSTSTPPPFPTSIPSIYATPPDPFPAVTSFVALSSSAYHLSLTHIRTNPPPPPPSSSHNHISPATHPPTLPNLPIRTFRDAFALYLSHHPAIQAIFVGTRRTDPHGAKLAAFQATDGEWPRFMRVHPVLDWRLSEIWCFLRWGVGHDAETETEALVGRTGYCGMYDEGYTSLGGRGDTVRNPRLKVQDGEEAVAGQLGGVGGGYRPAWTMVEDREERAGRE